MIDLFQYIDYPDVPPHIIARCLETIHNTIPFVKLFSIKRGPTEQCEFRLYEPPQELIEWLKHNGIMSSKASIQVMDNGTELKPHIDNEYSTRVSAINYILSNPGPVTSWYNEKNKNGKRGFTPIHSEIIEANKWHKINTSVFHGVTGINEPRISITISD
jgi:hypothetical protein